VTQTPTVSTSNYRCKTLVKCNCNCKT